MSRLTDITIILARRGVRAPSPPGVRTVPRKRTLVASARVLAAAFLLGVAPGLSCAAPADAPIGSLAQAQAPADPSRSPFGSVPPRSGATPDAPPSTPPRGGPNPGGAGGEIRFGIAAPFTGSSKEFGRQLSLGIETAFNLANESGGVNGRQLKLVSADDGYEPNRTLDAVKRLAEKDGVMGYIGNFGTSTAAVALPYALERKMLFFAPFTGSNLLRNVPPDRYVFNYRPSYAEETEAAVRYLVQVRGIRPRDIAVLAQDDGFGEAGYAGVAKAVRALPGQARSDEAPQRLTYKRNTVDVGPAVALLRARKTPPRAVIMVAVYRPAAKFIEATRPLFRGLIYTNVSAVGSSSLAEELMLLGPNYADGVIVTQVVPAVNGYSKAVLEFKTALGKYFPGEAPDYVSLEAYASARILIEGLKRAGPQTDTEKLVDALEGINDLDIGLGTGLKFGPSEHQASHMVWGTQLDNTGKYKAIDLQ